MNSTLGLNTNNGSATTELFNPDSLKLTKAKRYHGDLMDLLDNLSGKLSHVSSTVDKEFLSAYRVHMLTVQAELKSLKNDVSKGEQMLNSDAQVAKLEKESKWFSDECARLKQHFDAMTKDSKQMRQRLLDMAEQRNFLCDQLKAIMKRNKVLEVEIYQLKSGGDLQSLSISMGSASFLQYHHRHKGGDDHSSISNRYGGTKKQQLASSKLQQQQLQSTKSNIVNDSNYNSKVRFDPKTTDNEDDDDNNDPDPMTFLEEDDEDDEFAMLQRQLRSKKLRESQDSADENDSYGDNEDSSPSPTGYARNADSNRLNLPAPLQRAMASGRGDPLFGNRPNSSSRSGRNSPAKGNLRNSHSAVGLGQQTGPTRSMSPPTNNGMMSMGVSHSMPALPVMSVGNNGAQKVKPSSSAMNLQAAPHQHQPTQQQQKQHQQLKHKSDYEFMLTNRPQLELSLEQAIRDIFTEVRHRKKSASLLCSTKRPTGAAFSGMPASPPSRSKNPWAPLNEEGGSSLPKGMENIVQELDAQDDDIDPEPGSDGARLIKMTPNITQRGGIAGLGTNQFSENDRFAAMVKYLSQPEVFESVAERLYSFFHPPTDEELRASGQYLGKRRGNSAGATGTGRSPSISRANSPSAR